MSEGDRGRREWGVGREGGRNGRPAERCMVAGTRVEDIKESGEKKRPNMASLRCPLWRIHCVSLALWPFLSAGPRPPPDHR